MITRATTQQRRRSIGAVSTPRGSWRTTMLAGLYLASGGVHVGLASADPSVYRGFGSESFLALVRDGWANVFMAHPRIWALLLAAGEIAVGTALLAGGRAARIGWVAAIVFHVLLLLFGFGFWLYAVPALVVLTRARRVEWPLLEPRGRVP